MGHQRLQRDVPSTRVGHNADSIASQRRQGEQEVDADRDVCFDDGVVFYRKLVDEVGEPQIGD